MGNELDDRLYARKTAVVRRLLLSDRFPAARAVHDLRSFNRLTVSQLFDREDERFDDVSPIAEELTHGDVHARSSGARLLAVQIATHDDLPKPVVCGIVPKSAIDEHQKRFAAVLRSESASQVVRQRFARQQVRAAQQLEEFPNGDWGLVEVYHRA